MILGADHIALTCADADAAARELEEAGFGTRFVERGLPNHASKREMLVHPGATHDIAYSTAVSGIAVESTAHGSAGDTPGRYAVVLSGRPEDVRATGDGAPATEAALRAAPGDATFERCLWERLDAPVWCRGASGPCVVGAVVLETRDHDRAVEGWTSLGFRVDDEGGAAGSRWSRLRLRSPVPAWSVELFVTEVADAPSGGGLDDPGFPCLALLTNDIAADAAAVGRDAADAFGFRVGGRDLKVLVGRGRDGEPIELIEVSRG